MKNLLQAIYGFLKISMLTHHSLDSQATKSGNQSSCYKLTAWKVQHLYPYDFLFD